MNHYQLPKGLFFLIKQRVFSMKIALLNLPFDNNYGGNLQRYALMKVLQDMGHDVTHIYLRIYYSMFFKKCLFEYFKRFVKKYFLRKPICIFCEKKGTERENSLADTMLPFYEKYIKHSSPVKNVKQLCQIASFGYDAYIVGSDQVWRECMTRQLGIENYFFKFVKDRCAKKIAYGVSFGTDDCSFSKDKIKQLSQLYSNFNAVSYRECAAKQIFEKHGWNQPIPKLVLDPTLLLDQSSYNRLISENTVEPLTSGKIYCYILDNDKYVLDFIEKQKKKFCLDTIVNGINDKEKVVSIPQWLKNIKDAELVITDSYHGSIFSIIFRKPFAFIGNNRRGNARIESLFSLFGIEGDNDIVYCSESVYQKIEEMKKISLNFLEGCFV